jgi:hypothetical protein
MLDLPRELDVQMAQPAAVHASFAGVQGTSYSQ